MSHLSGLGGVAFLLTSEQINVCEPGNLPCFMNNDDVPLVFSVLEDEALDFIKGRGSYATSAF